MKQENKNKILFILFIILTPIFFPMACWYYLMGDEESFWGYIKDCYLNR